jgi:Superinfection immunity protein
MEIGMAEDPSLTGVIGVIVLVSCYFMPTIIALLRDKRGAVGVALANFLFGWTATGSWLSFGPARARPGLTIGSKQNAIKR